MMPPDLISSVPIYVHIKKETRDALLSQRDVWEYEGDERRYEAAGVLCRIATVIVLDFMPDDKVIIQVGKDMPRSFSVDDAVEFFARFKKSDDEVERTMNYFDQRFEERLRNSQ